MGWVVRRTFSSSSSYVFLSRLGCEEAFCKGCAGGIIYFLGVVESIVGKCLVEIKYAFDAFDAAGSLFFFFFGTNRV